MAPVSRRDRWAPALVLAALLIVLLIWLARRSPHDRVVTVAATPTIVAVPVPVAVVAPPAPTPAPPAPAPPVHVQVRAAPKPVAPPAAPVAVPPSDVTTRYREVGQLLHTHGTDDLWRRYRWIRLGDCLTTDAKRAECVQMLDAIQSDATGK